VVDEEDIFRAMASSGARVLLIGRRAMIVYGIPVLTGDHDLWAHIDDIEALNRTFREIDMEPNYLPADARRRGRYVLENTRHVDVLVARSQSTRDDATRLAFEDAWSRRVLFEYGAGLVLAVPCIPDLIITKRWALRAKDAIDIRLLESKRRQQDDA
jgi:hypothetical protein